MRQAVSQLGEAVARKFFLQKFFASQPNVTVATGEIPESKIPRLRKPGDFVIFYCSLD
jgi:hypothetical protein